MSALLHRLVLATFAIVSPLALWAQNQVVSVPFTYGFIGTVGSNTGQANNILTMPTLEVSYTTFSQVSDNGQFGGTQGNDLSGTLTLYLADNSTLSIPGAINWRITSGSTVHFFGFIPDPGSAAHVLTYGGSNTYTIDSTSNYGVRLNSASVTVTDGSNQSGNAATSGLLDALNAYLATVQANAPTGPVAVDALTTSSNTPTLTGTATLAGGETLSVTVDGVRYSTANGLTVSGGTWSLTIPGGNALADGTYDVTATITNSSGYTLDDATTSELTVQPPDTTPPVLTGPSGGAGAASSAISVNENQTAVTQMTANETVTWAITSGTDIGDLQIDASGTVTFVATPDFEAPADSDTNNTYVVTITAADGSGNSATQTLTVTVLDVVEDTVDPVITAPGGAPGASTGGEIVSSGQQQVAQFVADEAVSWSIVGGTDMGAFTISAAGVLSFVAPPDYNAPADANADNTYQVVIRATDVGGNFTDITYTVQVLASITPQIIALGPDLIAIARDQASAALRAQLSANHRMVRAAHGRLGRAGCHTGEDESRIDDRAETCADDVHDPWQFQGEARANDGSVAVSGGADYRSRQGRDGGFWVGYADISASRAETGSTTGTLSARIAREYAGRDSSIIAPFAGLDISRANINGILTGTHSVASLSFGVYAVSERDAGLILDVYAALGLGRNNLDLTDGSLDLSGDYMSTYFLAGAAVTGMIERENWTLYPELALDFGVARIGVFDVSGVSSGGTGQASFDGGQVSFASLTLSPEFAFPDGPDASWSIAPQLICSVTVASSRNSACGGGLALGMHTVDRADRESTDVVLSLSRTGDTTQHAISLRYGVHF